MSLSTSIADDAARRRQVRRPDIPYRQGVPRRASTTRLPARRTALATRGRNPIESKTTRESKVSAEGTSTEGESASVSGFGRSRPPGVDQPGGDPASPLLAIASLHRWPGYSAIRRSRLVSLSSDGLLHCEAKARLRPWRTATGRAPPLPEREQWWRAPRFRRRVLPRTCRAPRRGEADIIPIIPFQTSA